MKTAYSLKAELYDKYRWDYPKEAIDIIKEKSCINKNSILADFGAGTGKLTQHFNEVVHKIFAIEPDHNMMSILQRKKLLNTVCIEKYAHEINEIEDGSIDAIINGHSLHWFDYEKTISVFKRILKKDGLIVNINNNYSSGNNILDELSLKLSGYINQENEKKKNLNTNMYFEEHTLQEWVVPFIQQQTIDELINSMSSASFYPDISNEEIFISFKKIINDVFEKYQNKNIIKLNCNCLVQIGSLYI